MIDIADPQDITALAQPILEDRFHNQIRILSVNISQDRHRSTMDISYRGDPTLLQPQRFKGISRRMRSQLQAMGIHDPPLERYAQALPADGTTIEIDTRTPVPRAEFDRLADQWLQQRPKGVDVAHMTRHHAYQAIIDIGPDAIPWLLERLTQRPDHWFHALNQITHARPVQPQHQGIIAAMAQDWIEWGKSNQQEQNQD